MIYPRERNAKQRTGDATELISDFGAEGFEKTLVLVVEVALSRINPPLRSCFFVAL
jgi:hypothetical protein